MEHPNSALRYVAADRVDTPAGRLSGTTVVVSPSNGTLGTLDGIVVDPIGRKLRGYVVESRGWLSSRRYFVPPVLARFDRDHGTLELGVDSEEVGRLDEVGFEEFPPFSDDDLVAGLFHARPDDGDRRRR
jgi:hypothetical protein